MRRSWIVVSMIAAACSIVSSRAIAGPQPAPAPPAPNSQATPAATATPSSAPRGLGPVVVTAARRPTPLDATSRQTYVISAADLDRLGAQTAADSLRFIPGTVVQQYGTFGQLSTVALRGASAAQTLILINGQPVNEADTGSFDFSSLPVNVIDHIEVVQGGSSTLYGSAAMGGVVNIITKQPLSAGNVNAYAQLGYQGTFTRGLGFTAGGPDLLARVDVQAISASSNFAYPAYNDLYDAGVRTNSDAKNSDLGIALAGHLGVVNANASFHNDTSAIGVPGAVNTSFVSDFAQQQRIYQRFDMDFDLPFRGGDVELQVASNGRRLHFFDTSLAYQNGTPAFPYDNQANGATRSASLRTSFGVGRSNMMTAGYDTAGSDVTFDQAYVPPNSPEPKPCQGLASFDSCTAQSGTSAWYLQDDIHPPSSDLDLSLGVRDQRSQGQQATAVPTFGAVWHASHTIDMLANYGRALRTPNLDELYYPGYGSPFLQPEYGATFDLGMRCHAERIECTFSYFGQDTSNLIVNVPADAFGDLKPVNISRASVRGLETSISTTVGRSGHVYVAYTDFAKAADLSPGLAQPIRLLYRPTSTGAISLWTGKGSWTYGIDSTYVGLRYGDEANTLVLSPYLVTGVHVRKTISRHLALTLRADNVGNNHNAEDVLGYPIVGSAFSVRLSTR
ncbi:MAG: TonB-dependent receptor [Candidatus Eremiobacteraeota bacterium]|nr:TonB-dependent receptor [Candidatus Eremiobacteraeota bacterium]